jgi:hypothetical protein
MFFDVYCWVFDQDFILFTLKSMSQNDGNPKVSSQTCIQNMVEASLV